MHSKSIKEHAKALAKGEYSSVELTKHYLELIRKYNPKLNSFITITEEKALLQAEQADIKIKSQKATTLTGIPIAYKDLICTKDVKTTCASKMLADFIPPYSATLIEKLEYAGCVMLGKNNLDEFAMGSSNEHSYFGNCQNPWQIGRAPGGSSGGSASCVAAGISPASIGTDTGGSIRQPAAFCGITGLKPSYGRVSRFGITAFASSLDQAGPMAKNAEDVAIIFASMSGHDEKDATSLNARPWQDIEKLYKPLTGFKIGIPEEYLENGLDSDIANAIDRAKSELEKLGATCKKISLKYTSAAIPAYYVIATAECSSNLARYDGVRYGYRCKEPINIYDLYERSRQEGFGSEVKRRILIGTYALSSGYFDAYYNKAQQLRRLIADDFNNAFKEVDIILGPTTPTTAFKIGEKKDPVSMYLSDIYTTAVNLAGLPAISIPVGFSNNLPIGMQLIGKYLDEASILQAAHQFQQVTNWHLCVPEMINCE